MTPLPVSSTASNDPPGGRLDGWKEIAAYLDKSVRTVQRWEKELGLPIHRVGSGRGESVHALIEELERWRQTPPARTAEGEAEAAEHAEQAPLEVPTAAAPAAEPAAPGPPQIPQPTARAGRSPRGKPVTFREWLTATPPTDWIISLAVMLVTVVAIVWAIRPALLGIGPTAPAGETGPLRVPASYEVTRSALRIYDVDKRLLWVHQFDFPLHEQAYEDSVRARIPPVVMDEIDGDGRVEVLFVSEPGLPSSRGLYCFNEDGSLRFRHQPGRTVRFGNTDYTGPWRASRVFTTSRPNEPKSVWLASYHLAGFPAVLEKLDAAGQVSGEYWSGGQIGSVELSPPGGPRLVLVGASDEERRDGSLAVLDDSRPMGVSPSASPSYQCEGCPPGTPMAFLLFPRVEAARIVDGFAIVDDIRFDALGQIILSVRHETAPLAGLDAPDKARTRYFLNAAYQILSAQFDQSYRSVHAQLEKARLVDHPFGPRDEGDLWPVLRWDRDKFIRIGQPESE
jgi:hypothetical protein